MIGFHYTYTRSHEFYYQQFSCNNKTIMNMDHFHQAINHHVTEFQDTSKTHIFVVSSAKLRSSWISLTKCHTIYTKFFVSKPYDTEWVTTAPPISIWSIPLTRTLAVITGKRHKPKPDICHVINQTALAITWGRPMCTVQHLCLH